MIEQAIQWNMMAKQLWEEQAKEQLIELQDLLYHEPQVAWSELARQLAIQFAEGRENIVTTVLPPRSKEQIWAEAAQKLWQEQVKEQLLELQEFGLD